VVGRIAMAVLPRTAAPLALAVMREAGGDGAVPWALLAVALVGMAGFRFAARG
jgi:hypothetical protein